MHDYITHPKGSMVVVVTLKSKIAASSASSGGNSDLSKSSNKSPKPLPNSPATSEQMSAILPFKIFRLGEIWRHIGFMCDHNYHNARSSRKNTVLRHYA